MSAQQSTCGSNMSNLGRCLQAVTEQLLALENRLKALEEKEKNQVAFTALAETGGTYGGFNTTTTLCYNKVITNIGNAYNSCTGIFVAPVAGVYYFSIYYHAFGEHASELHLCKNNQMVVNAYDQKHGADPADNGANAVFLELQEGDQVCVRMPAERNIWAAGHMTSFSGSLCSRM